MRILGIDTTTKFFSLGISCGDKVYGYSLELGRKQSSLLMPSIERALSALGWKAGDIDYFACGLGPGSFTGVRLGLAAIKGLAWALNRPILGIPTLDVLARNVERASLRSGLEVVPAIDAKRGLIYCALYKNSDGILKRESGYMLIGIDGLLKKIGQRTIILGDALGLYKDKIIQSNRGAVLLHKDYWYPRPHNIIAIAQEKIKHKDFSDALRVKPIYLYPKECQIKMQKSKCKMQN